MPHEHHLRVQSVGRSLEPHQAQTHSTTTPVDNLPSSLGLLGIDCRVGGQ